MYSSVVRVVVVDCGVLDREVPPDPPESRLDSATAATTAAATTTSSARITHGARLAFFFGERVRAAQDACVDAIARAIASDTDLGEARARLLSVGLVGLSISSASAWLASRDEIPRDEAIELMTALLWRGVSAFPTTSK